MRKLRALVVILQGVTASASPSYLATLYPAGGSSAVCWGVLIAPRHVLTSAHCIAQPLAWVEIGNNVERRRKVVDAVAHPQYNAFTRSFDLAVVELDVQSRVPTTPLRWTSVDGSTSAALSWVSGSNSANVHELSILPDCTSITSKADATVICARTFAVDASCSGNSGRPLLMDGQVAGVGGVGCVSKVAGDVSTTTMYASVALGRSFLEPYLAAEANENPPALYDPRPSRQPIVESIKADIYAN
ncbi:hypothetical protein H257_12651 [Aphanomyces astaci]|uniref:Peptidase S1 domain-containing protein n=1 Tax=Aphanomyces astaci TaxID=112090 RepID=W4FXE7_APHAT|nr:hypothetical protein H257_12651 [Aphanomyces astaci]ETV72175.1 hypothetical protein H257_12651 [Aphanomyces astaci]|eukprot:XP_009838243.1 hypothetical protein H257_12651 [Aphanomyces astaci]